MGGHGTTTRPRPSLSCATCRARKVRCTKEQPACHSCVRTNTNCVYDKDAWKSVKAQTKQKQNIGKRKNNDDSNSNSSNVDSRQGSINGDAFPPDEEWSQWTRPTFDGTQSPSTMAAASRDPKRKLSRPLDTDISNPSTASVKGGGQQDDIKHTDNPIPMTSEPFNSNTEQNDLYDGFSSASPWAAFYTNPPPGNLNQQDGMQTLESEDATLHRPYFVRPSYPNTSPASPVMKPQSSNGPSRQNSLSHLKISSRDFASEGTGRTPKVPGYLSIRSGARSRYIGRAFWAYVDGDGASCESFLGEAQDAADGLPQPHIDFPALAALLPHIPPKPVCDSLLSAFLIGVRPICLLLHVPSFRSDYNDFWNWYQEAETASPARKLVEDPTFLCLLLSILYCGAVSASLESWSTEPLRDSNKEVVCEQLLNASSTSLKLVQYLKFPTFNTLVAMLLKNSCLRDEGDSSGHTEFISNLVRVSQTMGLHLDPSELGFDAIQCEMRRRIWWHILWLDLQNSILHGSQLCSNDHQTGQPVAMISDIRDKDISESQSTSRLITPGSSSASTLFAIGRFEFTRFQRLVVNCLSSSGGLEGHLSEINSGAKTFQVIINKLVTKMPAQGIPEGGLIPYRLANASPLNRKEIYGDHMHEPTVFTAWARIMLTMMKTEAAIFVERMFLESCGRLSKQGQSKWRSIVQLCMSYLRNFCQLIQVPAFRPYIWFCYTYSGPLQAVLLTLTYFQTHREPEAEVKALHLVDEVIDFFVPEDDSPHPSSIGKQWPNDKKMDDKSINQTNPAWIILRAKRSKLSSLQDAQELKEESCPTPISLPGLCHKSATPQSGNTSRAASVLGESHMAAANGNYQPCSQTNIPISNLTRGDGENPLTYDMDVDMMIDQTSLDAWSSSLIADSKDFLFPDQSLPLGGPIHDANTTHFPTGSRAPFQMGSVANSLGMDKNFEVRDAISAPPDFRRWTGEEPGSNKRHGDHVRKVLAERNMAGVHDGTPRQSNSNFTDTTMTDEFWMGL